MFTRQSRFARPNLSLRPLARQNCCSMTVSAHEITYDEVPYESNIVAGTHPEHLRAIATLFGIESAPAEACRVLEIGCSDGSNLMPMAYGLPRSTFVGIDPSGRQIAMGHANLQAFGPANVELLVADVREIVNWDRQFDYIVCHGVFSWVPDDVRDAILAASRRLLAPNGIAYISYNVLPGFHFRAATREMMRFHTARFEDPIQRAEQGRALMNFLVESTGHLGDGRSSLGAYHIMLKEEQEMVAGLSDSYVVHEHLAEHNQAYYFHEFAALAGSHDLQYLGDSTFPTMMLADLPQKTRDNIQAVAGTQMALEQYRDFVTNRTFRKTLLCRDDTVIHRQITAERIARLTFRERIGRGPSQDWRIGTIAGSRLKVSDPNAQELLNQVERAAPLPLTFRELQELISNAARTPLSDEQLAAMLLSLYAVDAVDFRTWTPPVASVVSARPLAYEPARRAKPGIGRTPVPIHGIVQLDPFVESVLPLVDGTRTAREIAAEVVARIAAGTFEVDEVEQHELPKPDEVPRLVDESLEHLRRFGVLIS